jgi:hypothetical protein
MSSYLNTYEASDLISNAEVYDVFEADEDVIANASVAHENIGEFVVVDANEIVNGANIFNDLPKSPQADLSALNDPFGEFGGEEVKNEQGFSNYQFVLPPWSNADEAEDVNRHVKYYGARAHQMDQQQPCALGSQQLFVMPEQQQPGVQNTFPMIGESQQFYQDGQYQAGDNAFFVEEQDELQIPVQINSEGKKKTSQSTKRNRATLCSDQKMILEDFYRNKVFPNKRERQELGNKTGLHERQVQIWFQNRRRQDRESGAPRADPRGRKSKMEMHQ